MAHNVFEYGKSIGNNFTLLDMGGGFPGHFGSEGIFEEHVTAINSSLLKYFNDEKITVIAEPGTYFGMSPFTLAVCVTSKRQVTDSGSKVHYLQLQSYMVCLYMPYVCALIFMLCKVHGS